MLADQWLLTNAPPRLKHMANSSFSSIPQATCKWQFATLDGFASCWCVMAQTALDPFVASSERSQWQSRINVARKHCPAEALPDTTRAIRLLRQSETNRRAERKLMQSGSGFTITLPAKLGSARLGAMELLAVWTDFALGVVGGSQQGNRQSIAAVTFALPPDEPATSVSIEVLTNSASYPPELEGECVAWLPEALQPLAELGSLSAASCRTPQQEEMSLGGSVHSTFESLPPSMATSAANSIAPELSLPPTKETKKEAKKAKVAKEKEAKEQQEESAAEKKKAAEVERKLSLKEADKKEKEAPAAKSAKKADTPAASASASAKSVEKEKSSSAEDAEAQVAAKFVKEAEQRAKKLDTLCRNFNDEKAAFEKVVAETVAKEGKDGAAELVAEFSAVAIRDKALQKLVDSKPTPTFAASTPKLAKLASQSPISRAEMQVTQELQADNFNKAVAALKLRTQRAKALAAGIAERRDIEHQCAQRTASLAGNMKKQCPQQQPEAAAEDNSNGASTPPAEAESVPEKKQQQQGGKKGKHKKDGSKDGSRGASTKDSPSKKDAKGASPGKEGAAGSKKDTTAAATAGAGNNKAVFKDNDKLFKMGILSLVTLLLAVIAAAMWE